ncbi:MAG: ArdC-like ssDNA-binding domain-containing protein [Prochlorococcaceae cyanobacterium]
MAVDSPPGSKSSPKKAAVQKTSPEEKLVASLIALLEAGTTPWRREWDYAAGGHHVNLLSGRRYRGANPVLLTLGLHLRGSALPYWCGFAEAKALGIFPRKGSKAVHVLRPQVHRLSEGRLAEAAPGVDAGTAARSWVSYRPVALFNAADLEGEALQGLIQKRWQAAGVAVRPEPERLAAAEAVLSSWPVEVRFGGDRACYLPGPDRIQLPDRAAFLPGVNYVGGSRQLRRRVGPPTPCHGRGLGRADVGGRLAGNCRLVRAPNQPSLDMGLPMRLARLRR